MPTLVIDGHRFAAPGKRKERATSTRKLAMLDYAHQRALDMAPQGATDLQRASLVQAVQATHELAEYGAAYGTLDKDDHAWNYWVRFNELYGWDPIISEVLARSSPHVVSQRLAIFQAWVYPQLRGKHTTDAKPQTVFSNYVLAIIRLLAREHIPMPKAKQVERNLAGIMRAYKNLYGVEHLMPGRKQPLTPTMWARIEALPEGQQLPGRSAAWSPATRWRDATILRLGRTLWRTGHRLGEIVYHPSDEINYLTRSCISITKADGRKIPIPSQSHWTALVAGDSVQLAPCVSKSDQFGQEHCPFASDLPFDGSNTSAAAAIRDIELLTPCAPQDRSSTPLFADEAGRPFTYAVLHAELKRLLSALYGAPFAAAFSWHSIRIGLACALFAAKAPDEIIQLICRWASPDSLKAYRRMGIESNIHWTNQALMATFDATAVNNIPALDNDDYMREQVAVFDADPALPTQVLGHPTSLTTPILIPQPLSRSVQRFPIVGGHVQAYDSDREGLLGLSVRVPSSFWAAADRAAHEGAATVCLVAAECVREFLHPDGSRSHTYLLRWNGQFFPIKRASLINACLSREQRSSLTQG